MNEILLIDDDHELCSSLTDYLTKHGFQVEAVHEGRLGLEAARNCPDAVVLLDLMLPDLDGFEVLRQLRKDSAIRVMLLTARGDDVDKILGLEVGADDYITKPFNPRELVARIRAIVRRGAVTPANARVLRAGPLELDMNARRISAGKETIQLTGVEFSLLETLMQAPNEIVGRESLTDTVLGRKFYQFDRSLDMHVCRLRRKLDKLCGIGNQLRTIRGVGYQLEIAERKTA